MKCKYKTIWITKDGKKVPLKKLSKEHLTNVINYIDKVTKQEALEQLAKKYKPDIYYHALKELGKR